MPDEPLFRIEPTLAGKQRECAAFSRSPFTTSVLIYSICALVGAGLLYAGTQKVARKATVSGRVELSGGELKLYPSARRMVSEVHVREGELVEKGQLLALLHGVQHAPQSESEKHSGYERLQESLQQQAIRLQEARTAAKHSAAIEQNKIASKRVFFKKDKRSLRRSLNTTNELLALASEQKSRGTELYESGNLSLTDLEELDRRQLQQKARVTENERVLLSLNEQLRVLDHEELMRTEALQTRLRDIDAQLGANEREREKLRMSFEQRLIAPFSGFITGVMKQTGATASPDVPLITMLRTRSTFHAKLWAGSHSAGELQLGQKVNLMVDAFPHQKHGMLGGEITHINTSPLTLRELEVPWEGRGSAYAVTVLMDKTNPLYGRIKPGMNVTADIKLDNSLLVARLFEPLLLAWRRTL